MKPAQQLAQAALAIDKAFTSIEVSRRLKRPVIILAAPRSGSTLLFEQMQKIEGLWSIGGESHIVYASMPHLRFENAQMDSGSLFASHASDQIASQFRAALLYLSRDSAGRAYVSLPQAEQPKNITLIEKTPRNALALPFLNKIFPDARFIYLHRQAEQNIASIATAWQIGQQTGRFVTYPNLLGFNPRKWCFLLPRGWRNMVDKSIVEIAAFQWQQANQMIVEGLSKIAPQRYTSVSYEAFITNPESVLSNLARFCNSEFKSSISVNKALPLSKTTVSQPDPNKWKVFEEDLARIKTNYEETQKQILKFHTKYKLK